MSKTVEFEVVCPDCGWVQKYHSYKKDSEIKGERRTECKRCGRGFKALDQRKSKVSQHRKKEDENDRPFGFHKYSKSEE